MFITLKHYLKWKISDMKRHLVINGLTVNIKEHWNNYIMHVLFKNSNRNMAKAQQL